MEIICKIQGGIGNQLNQYAFALGLRQKLGTSIERVFIDLSFYESKMVFERAPIEINQFLKLNTNNSTFEKNFISRLSKKFNGTILRRFFYSLNLKLGNVITENQEFGFKEEFINRNFERVSLQGYFCDIRYIKNGLDELKIAFQNLTKGIELNYDGYVALHIRRGDYEKIKRSTEKSNILALDYYKRSLAIFETERLKIRVYTDDYVWAKNNLQAIFKNYEFDFGPEEYSDIDSLWTMSKHQYLIAANSTFSLWAYYFNMLSIKCFTFPKEWAETIQNKGYQLFDKSLSNVLLVNEE